MNAPAKIAATESADAAGWHGRDAQIAANIASHRARIDRERAMTDFAKGSRNVFAAHFDGSNYDFALAAASLLYSDEDKLSLMIRLLDTTDFDNPDMRGEIEDALTEALRSVEA